ncbi:MAG: diguanylate cyclase [Phormidesmis sp.]
MSILSEQSIALSAAKVLPETSAAAASGQLVPLQQPADLLTIPLTPAQRQQQSLQMLSVHPSIYGDDLQAAAKTLTSAAAIALMADRVSLWTYSPETGLKRMERYDRSANAYASDTAVGSVESKSTGENLPTTAVLNIADYPLYFEGLGYRVGLTVENVMEAVPATAPTMNCLVQQNLIFHEPGAFLEVPVRYQGEVIGVLWCEHTHAHRWTALENAAALSVSLVAATAIASQQQRGLAHSLENHRRQLRRESIEREQAEQAWQESQRFIQGIIDASTNILYVDSFIDGSNFYISRWIKTVLGYEPEEVQKLGPHYLEKLVHTDEKALMASERLKLAAIKDGEVVENEYRFRHRQGNWRWLLCRETVFNRDKQGQPTQVFGTATDITKRKHAEVALKEFNQELERLASMDGLTQVANRRSFDQYLKKAWKSVGSGRSSLSLILCDIDYFKSFNDTYGHQAGDVCLQQVAQEIQRSAKRSTDLVARYGGEEFAIILPNTGEAGVQHVAQEIQRSIQQLEIPHSQSGVSEYITLSLGLATVNSTNITHPDILVAAADQGLYQAKYEGRDRFCVGEVETP